MKYYGFWFVYTGGNDDLLGILYKGIRYDGVLVVEKKVSYVNTRFIPGCIDFPAH